MNAQITPARPRSIPKWAWWVGGITFAGVLMLAACGILLVVALRQIPRNQTLVDARSDVNIGMYWGQRFRLNRDAECNVQLDVEDGAPVSCYVMDAAEWAAFDASKAEPVNVSSGISGQGLTNFRNGGRLTKGEWSIVIVPQDNLSPFPLIHSSRIHLKVTLKP